MKITKKKQLLQTIITKAWEDFKFKQELISNPEKAIERLTSKKVNLLKGKKLVVNDQTNEDIIYINIPAKYNMHDMELNEEQLEIVAGGGVLSNPFKTAASENK